MEHELTIWKAFLILAISVLLCTICYTAVNFPGARAERPGLVIGGPPPVSTATPEPTATPNAWHQMVLIQAEADARSQAANDSIRQTVVVHTLRRETLYDLACLGAPWALIVLGCGVFGLWAWRRI